MMTQEEMKPVRGRPFEKEHSGNPAGRPPGKRNKATLLAEALLDEHAHELTKKLIERAHAGEMKALGLCMKLILNSGAGRKRPVEIELPPLVTAADGLKTISLIFEATARGEISTDEAQQFADLVDIHRRSLEDVEVVERLRKLEEARDAP